MKSVKNKNNQDELDWLDDLTDEQKEDLEKSIAQADRGEVVTHSEAMKKYDILKNIE